MDESVKVEPGWKFPLIEADIQMIAIFTIITVISIYLPIVSETPLRSLLGLIMVLFIPGYAITAALFPGKKNLDNSERIGLSFGLSIVVTPLIGLALNYTPWGIRPDAVVVCLTFFSIITCAVANLRRHELKPGDRFSVDIKKIYKEARAKLFQGEGSRLDQALSIFLLVCIIASIATLAFVVMAPKTGEKFTQFYILGPNGQAEKYPERFNLGDSKPVIVGITNNEYRDVAYDIVVALKDSAGVSQLYTDKITLSNNQSIEKQINLKPDRSGTNMEIEFLLYADEDMVTPYRELHYWVDVSG